MEDNIKKYDFFAALAKNDDIGLSDLKQLGVTPDNSELKSKSDYEGMQQVREFFSDADGNFNKEAFDKFYDNALLLYNNFDMASYAPKATDLFGYLSSDWDRPLEARIVDTTPFFSVEETAPNQSYGIDYIGKFGQGIYANKTAKEIAESQEVVDYRTGESLGWTPEDKGGLFKGLVRPTIVMATYDEDEDETLESGEIIHHKKGDLKFNKNGRPYAELLGDRDINQKQQIAYSDTLMREESAWNKYNFFDSDDYEKSFVGTIAKLAVKTIPYFIPGVNYVVGALTAAEAFARVLPVIGKAINGVWTNDSENEFYKTLNQFEGFMARFDPTSTQESQESLMTFENFGNLISSISGQLFQQKAVGMAGMLFNIGENGSKNAAKIGRVLSYSYMAATSSQNSYNVAKEAGASDRVAGLFMFGNMLSLYGMMHANYFRDNFFKNTYMDESEFRQPAFDYAQKLREKLTTSGNKLIQEGERAVTKKENLKVLGKIIDFYHNTMVPSVVKGGLPARMLSEATEEVMEEVVQDAWKGATSALNSLGFNVTENEKELDFNFSLEDVLQRYGMAFFGGFIGGGIFAGQQKYENWIMHNDIQSMPDDDMKKLVYYIAQGRGKEIKDYYTNWHRRGLLGSKNLGTDLTTIDSIDGQKIVAESTNGKLSQNDIVYRQLMNTVDFLEKIVSSEGLRFSKQQLDNLRKLGLDVNENTLRAQTLIDLGGYNTLEDDLLNLAKDIVKKNDEIQAKIDELTVPGDTSTAKQSTDEALKNNDELKQLQDELKDLKKRREDILEGKLNYRYALQSLFISDKQLSDAFINLSKDNFARLKYGELYSTMSDEQKEIVDKDFENYKATDGKEKIIKAADIYYALASRWGESLIQSAKTLDGFNLDTLHSNANLDSELIKTKKQLVELEKQIVALESKETLTPEEREQLNNYRTQYFNIVEQFEAYENLPGRLLALANNDEHFKEITSLFLNPNLDAVGIAKIGDFLIELYQKAANDKIVLSGDSELQVLYNEIRRDYSSNSNPKMRMNAYFNSKMAASDAIDEQNDAPEGTKWESEQKRVNGNTDEDVWYVDEPGEQSDLHDEIEGYLNSFIENFGYNNQAAINAYNNIVQTLKARTKLSDDEINEFLQNVMPLLNGKLITEFMLQIDGLRQNVTYSPINSLLKDFWFDYAGTRSTILDLIEAEEKKLATSEFLGKYSLTPMVEEDLKMAKNILKVVGAILVGSTNKTNATINSFKFNPKELPVIENKAALILANDLDQLSNRIDYLIRLTESNKNRAFKVHERIDKNMRSKFLQVLTNPAFVSEFEKKFHYRVGDIDKPINLKEIFEEITPPNFSLDNAELINPTQLQFVWTEFCQRVREELAKTSQFKDDKLMANSLLELFGKEIWKLNTTTLSDNVDVDIKPTDKLVLLMSIVGLPARAFYNRYKNVTQSEQFPFAPVFGQEYATYCALAYLARPGLFNTTLDLIKQNAQSEFNSINDTKTKEYLKALSPLRNFFTVFGSAGTGKSTGCVGTIVGMLSDYKKKQYIAIAPKAVQAKRLQSQIGENCKYLVKDDFIKAIHKGADPKPYVNNTNTGHVTRQVDGTYSNNIFDNSMDIKVLFIDEVSLFTESELSEISNWAVQNGVFIFALGDPKQNGAKAFIRTQVKNDDGTLKFDSENKPVYQTITYVSGLEDCMYFGAPMLTASLRTANIAKKTNAEIMDSTLFQIWNTLLENRALTLSEVDNMVPGSIELKYYEGNGQFFGDKVVSDDFDLTEKAIQLKSKGSVAIIYDGKNSKYDHLKDKGIEIIAFDDMQGGEYDYVLVDVDFRAQATNGINPSAYLLLKNLYTITQRSKYGTYIKHDKVDSTFEIVDNGSDVEMRQEFSLTKGQIEQFKKYRAKSFETLPEDDSFFSYFAKFNVPAPSGQGGAAVQPDLNEPESPSLIPGKKLISTKEINKFIFSTDFRKRENNNEHSLFKVVQKFKSDADFKTYDSSNTNPNLTLYTEAISYFASQVRKNKSIERTAPIFQKLNKALGIDAVDYLRSFLTKDKTLHIVEFNGNEKLLVARFHNGTEYIEIPVCTVNTAFVGDYNGKLFRKRSAKIKFGKEFKTLDQIQKEFPGLFWFNDAGVIIYNPLDIDKIKSDPTLTDGAIEFLTRKNKNGKTNLGKVLVIATDEFSDLEEYNDVWTHPEFTNGKKTNLLTHYDQISPVAIHKPLRMDEIISYVDAVKRGIDGSQSDLSNIIHNALWENSSNPVEVIKSLDWNALPPRETSAFYSEVYKRKWQVLPLERGNHLAGILALKAADNSQYKDVLDNLQLYLHTFVADIGTIKREEHGIVISNGVKSIYITPNWNGDVYDGYRVHNYGVYGIGNEISRSTNNYQSLPIKKIINQFLDGNSDNLIIELKRDVTRTDGSKQLVDVTVNDVLYTELSSFVNNKELVNQLTNDLLNTKEFCNFVYMDDMAKDRKLLPGSRFFGEFAGDFMNGYVAPISGFEYSQYEIDETKIAGTPIPGSNPSGGGNNQRGGGNQVDPRLFSIKNSINAINQLIDTYKLGNQIKLTDADILSRLQSTTPEVLIYEIIQNINSKNQFSQNNWMGQEIIFEDEQFKVNKIDNTVAWIQEKTRAEGTNPVIMDNYLSIRKYATFTLTKPDGTIGNYIIRLVNGTYEPSKFESYPTFKALLDLCKTDQSYFKNIAPYIHSLVYDYQNTSAVYAQQAYNWLCDNYYEVNPNMINPKAAEIARLLNEHLENRLSENEC